MIGDELGGQMTAIVFQTAKLSSKLVARASGAGLKKLARLTGKGGKALADKVTDNQESLKALSKDGSSVQGAEVDRTEIAGFDKYARRYHLRYSLVRQKNDPQKYVLFFRTQDASRLEMAVRDAVKDGRLENDSLRTRIAEAQKKSLSLGKERNRQQQKEKTHGRTKGIER